MRSVEESKRRQVVEYYTELQEYVMTRLAQTVALNKSYAQSEEHDPFLVKVLQRSLYSCFRDCQDENLEQEARFLLSNEAK